MKQNKTFSDQELVQRILNGEKSLYEIIVRRFNPFLYKIGRSYNYNHEDTQDLMQDTFVDAYHCLQQFEGKSSLKTWIIRIMMNQCYHKRQKYSFKNELNLGIKEDALPLFNHNFNETEKNMQAKELKNIIEQALIKIPEDYRMVFSLREINGLNIQETADILNITEGNVKVRLNRAKNMLKNEIEKSYVGADLFEFNLVYCDAIVENVMKRI
jgi:RNA polymerase sigma-70 factor (ECF subfamily)